MKIEVRNKKVIVAGSGKSGIGATELLCKVGAKIVLYDGNETKYILNDKELIKYVKESIPKILDESIKSKITKVYATDKYFKEYVDKRLKWSVI